MKLDKDELDIYKAEWAHCEEGISRYDTLTFQVRGWAASAVAALLAAAFTLHANDLALVSAFSAIIFWLIEAMHKIYQSVFIERTTEIQNTLRAHVLGNVTPEMRSRSMIGLKFEEGWKAPIDSFANIIRAALPRNVSLLYGTLFCVCIGTYFIIK